MQYLGRPDRMGKRRRIAQAVRDDGALAAQYYQTLQHAKSSKRYKAALHKCATALPRGSHFEVQVSLMCYGAAALTLQEQVNLLGFLKHKSSC